jgi:hypothetical protein
LGKKKDKVRRIKIILTTVVITFRLNIQPLRIPRISEATIKRKNIGRFALIGTIEAYKLIHSPATMAPEANLIYLCPLPLIPPIKISMRIPIGEAINNRRKANNAHRMPAEAVNHLESTIIPRTKTNKGKINATKNSRTSPLM